MSYLVRSVPSLGVRVLLLLLWTYPLNIDVLPGARWWLSTSRSSPSIALHTTSRSLSPSHALSRRAAGRLYLQSRTCVRKYLCDICACVRNGDLECARVCARECTTRGLAGRAPPQRVALNVRTSASSRCLGVLRTLPCLALTLRDSHVKSFVHRDCANHPWQRFGAVECWCTHLRRLVSRPSMSPSVQKKKKTVEM